MGKKGTEGELLHLQCAKANTRPPKTQCCIYFVTTKTGRRYCTHALLHRAYRMIVNCMHESDPYLLLCTSPCFTSSYDVY